MKVLSPRSRVSLVALLCAVCMSVLSAAACSSDHPPLAEGDSLRSAPPISTNLCDHPNPGCPCAQSGVRASCGSVDVQIGNTVNCSLGQTTCDGVKWGACVGDVKGNSFTIGVHVASLGPLQPSCTNNPCDPYCNQFGDTSDGVDAGVASGLTSDDAGLRISGSPCNPMIAPCPVVACGDGTVGGTEQCDDGNAIAGDGCTSCMVDAHYTCTGSPSVCHLPVCGNGLVNAPEQCDDGNVVPGDGCSATCALQAGWQCPTPNAPCVAKQCGDGIIAGDEVCDNGNHTGCVGCVPNAGYACNVVVGPPQSVCHATTCGDAIKEGSEQCDDGNRRPYDGCSPTCQIEPVCTGGTCTAVCGDGLKFPTEGCDDGDVNSGDGCSSACTVETGFTCVNNSSTPSFLDIPILYRDMMYSGCGVAPNAPSVASTANNCCSGTYKACGNVSGTSVCTVANQLSDCCSGVCNPATLKCTGTGTTGNRCIGTVAGHPDFEKAPGSITGLVSPTLGTDNEPVAVAFGSVFTNATSAYWWFHDSSPGGSGLPTAGANPYARDVYLDGSGNPTVLHLLQQTPPATSTIYEYASTAFFPIDGLGWETSPNARELDKNSSSSPYHNFSFTSEVHYPFQYLAGSANLTFTFLGDDDVWAFINGHLVADLGGQHGAQTATFTMNASAASTSATIAVSGTSTNCKATSGTASQTCANRLGLVDGNMYSIDVFQAEQHVTGSNYTLSLGGFVHTLSSCSAVCGDGLKKGSEACDNGSANSNTTYGKCKTDCSGLNSYCGDGIVNGPEQCDNGTNSAAYGGTSQVCGTGCVWAPYCGDGIVSNSEQCDLGAANGTGACSTTCTAPLLYNNTFVRDFAGSCASGTSIVWKDVGIEGMFPASGATAPTSASVQIHAQVASTVAGLGAAPSVSVGTLTGPPADKSAFWTDFDLVAPLTAYPNQPNLRVSFTLIPTGDHVAGPSLLDWRARFDCVPSQ